MKENTVYFFKLSVSNFKTWTIPKSLLYIEFVNNLCTIILGLSIFIGYLMPLCGQPRQQIQVHIAVTKK